MLQHIWNVILLVLTGCIIHKNIHGKQRRVILAYYHNIFGIVAYRLYYFHGTNEYGMHGNKQAGSQDKIHFGMKYHRYLQAGLFHNNDMITITMHRW